MPQEQSKEKMVSACDFVSCVESLVTCAEKRTLRARDLQMKMVAAGFLGIIIGAITIGMVKDG